jgi:hypothetical protein
MVMKLLVIARGGGCLLGAALLWAAAGSAAPPVGSAIVHVSELRVDVTVDDRTYLVEAWQDSPIVCEQLREGHHRLRMEKGGRVLYDEAFTIRPGEEVVLTAWCNR